MALNTGAVAWEPVRPKPERRAGGGAGGADADVDRGGGGGRGRWFHRVAVDQRLAPDQLQEGWWVLAVADEDPVAFLSPAAAAAATTAETVGDYLRSRQAGYLADLRDYEQVFHRYLAEIGGGSLVVFDASQLQPQGFSPLHTFALTEGYCEKLYDPPPGETCDACTCELRYLTT